MRGLSHPIQGIIWAVISCLFAAIQIAIVRHLSVDGVHPLVTVFYRNAIALVLFAPWAIRQGRSILKREKLWLYTVRGLAGFIAMILWFYALAHMPLPEAVALNFTAPLFATIAAAIMLRETVGWHRWAALIIGFCGVIIILRPGIETFKITSLLVLVVSFLWAINGVIIKQLTITEKPIAIVFYMALIMTPLSVPFALPYFHIPTGSQVLWLVALGIIANLSQLTLSLAISKTDLSIITPFDFCRLVFTSIIAYYAFNETIDAYTLGGAIIILSSAAYIARREHLLAVRQR